ncbi:mucin-5AC-like isoform X5 [Eriocheir sinensis]|uniref:mucin-5AC-like isoform X5 n=1 Tax=Eriocheir sinensis TaxID=95602 RepID=UPI0021C8EA82|nr:mucin-5AC-like isoform X5 [Eriocheir sinensis]
MVSPGVPNMAMVNVNNFLNVKDSRWLQLEVCREFQRNKCTRPDTECKFAHPPPNVEVQNGRVTACYDSIKGRCNREKPPCKYFHPPQHLKDQLLINGRNHLALKNAIMTQIQGLSPGTPVVPGTIPIIQPPHLPPVRPSPFHDVCCVMMPQHNSSPYLAGIPTMSNFNPYIPSSPVMAMGVTDGAVASPITGVVPQQAVVPAQKVPRTDRLEAFPGMGVPYKRPAGDKSGLPVYQPGGSAAYQQALMQQLGGQSFVPVSCEYGGGVALPGPGGQAEGHDTTTSTTTSTAANNHHAAASSAQPPTTSSPTPTTTTTSSPPSSSKVLHSSLIPSNSSSSSSSSSSVGGGEMVPVTPSALGPQQPVNVFYTGYALSKGMRPQLRHQATPGSAMMAPMHHPMSTMGFAPPGLPPGTMPSFTYSMGAPISTLSMPPYVSSSQQLMSPVMTSSLASMGMGLGGAMHPSLGGLTAAGVSPAVGGMTGLGGLGAGMPLMMPQNPMSSLYPSQYTALSSNTPFAQGGEQPSKRLKTS